MYLVFASDFDRINVVFGLFETSQDINPNEPQSIGISAAFSEKVSSVQHQVIGDPHDFLGKVVVIDNKMGSIT